MTTCNVKGVTYSEELIDNNHPTLQFPSALLSIFVSFCSLFWLYSPYCTVLIQSNRVSSNFRKRKKKPSETYCTIPAQHQMVDRQSLRLADWSSKQSYKENEY